jgi:hypothetical protein
VSRKLVVLAAAGALVVATLALQPALALDKPGTVQITDSLIRHTHIDSGKRGASAGDLDVYSMLLYNKRITPKSIGHAEMVCTAVGTKRQSCNGTYFLPKGTIVVQGVIDSRLIYGLAVVGGTSLYNNVRGALTVTSLHRSPVQELLVFRLVV